MRRNPAEQSAYEAAVEAYDAAYEKVADGVDKPGIVVMRWRGEMQAAAQGKLLGVVALGGTKTRAHGGLVVAAGLRQSVLHVGPDIGQIGEWVPKSELSKMRVATHALQTKNAIWVKDLTLESVFGVSAKYENDPAFQEAPRGRRRWNYSSPKPRL